MAFISQVRHDFSHFHECESQVKILKNLPKKLNNFHIQIQKHMY